MNPADLAAFGNHLWQSTLFAAVAGLVTLGLRKNRAQVRHGVWLAASCKFLIPLSGLIVLGGQFAWRTAPQTTQSNLSVVIDQVSQPFTAPVVSLQLLSAASPAATSLLPAVLLGIWACGFFGIAGAWWIRWRRIRAVVRAGSPVELAIPIPAMASPTTLEPGVFGVFRPVLLLPESIFERLTPAQLHAVIAHELCHVRHRDNLIAAVHMFVETVFWFHPLVWWIGKQMAQERERACDEEVLRLGCEPRVYAEGILNVCKLYVESPLVCMSGITGSNLKKRITAIMGNRVGVRLSFAKKVALAGAAMAALAAPVIFGMVNAPGIEVQSSSLAQSAPPATPKFEVVSVKPCKADTASPGRIGGLGIRATPGRLSADCVPLKILIQHAYLVYANGQYRDFNFYDVSFEGAPAWIQSERYTINAKAEASRSAGMMNGPMLQALLEDRFRLKMHRATREAPAYELVVAKGGPRLKPFDGSCTPVDWTKTPQPPPGPKDCRNVGGMSGPNATRYWRAISIDDFIAAVLDKQFVGRPVVNKTGITGVFDIHLTFTPEQSADAPDAGPSIFAALQEQLGLKLVPARGREDYLVIDHVERPSEN
jgi:bla regulator protein BlaR1